MKSSINKKLQKISERFNEINELLKEKLIIERQKEFVELSKEYSQIAPIMRIFEDYRKIERDIEEVKEFLKEDDSEIKNLAKREMIELKMHLSTNKEKIEHLLVPKDKDDGSNVFLEIRGGAGGNEASIFAGNLFRLYSRYCEKKGWKIEIINKNEGEKGGFKEIITKILGTQVFSKLKFESGTHRVQRIPETESQGRLHTSTCTVAVMPEPNEITGIEINAKDLKIDTFRASGAGGQHVNKTDSAIRITHIATGIVVECQAQRSQHKNRAQALLILQARLLEKKREEQKGKEIKKRKNLIGNGTRSERIRTYNYHQGRIKDHRINFTSHEFNKIMEGELDMLIDPLNKEYQNSLLERNS